MNINKQLATVYYQRIKDKKKRRLAEGKCSHLSCNNNLVSKNHCEEHRLIYNERSKIKKIKAEEKKERQNESI